MEKLHFSIQIDAPREKVWDTMLEKGTYEDWTSAFNPSTSSEPGSTYRGDWSEGSKMLFVANNENGKEEGMVSMVRENRKPEFISIEHIGIMKDGVEDTTSEAAAKWSPAFENYTFTESDGGTLLEIDVDTADEYKQMFEEMWAKALPRLKELCES